MNLSDDRNSAGRFLEPLRPVCRPPRSPHDHRRSRSLRPRRRPRRHLRRPQGGRGQCQLPRRRPTPGRAARRGVAHGRRGRLERHGRQHRPHLVVRVLGRGVPRARARHLPAAHRPVPGQAHEPHEALHARRLLPAAVRARRGGGVVGVHDLRVRHPHGRQPGGLRVPAGAVPRPGLHGRRARRRRPGARLHDRRRDVLRRLHRGHPDRHHHRRDGLPRGLVRHDLRVRGRPRHGPVRLRAAHPDQRGRTDQLGDAHRARHRRHRGHRLHAADLRRPQPGDARRSPASRAPRAPRSSASRSRWWPSGRRRCSA